MERSREYDDIAAVLAELRPEPRPDFAAELDALVARGFQSSSRTHRSPVTPLVARLRGLSPQRLLLATGGGALAAIAIATVIVASIDSGPGPVAFEQPATIRRHAAKPLIQFSREIPQGTNQAANSSRATSEQGSSS